MSYRAASKKEKLVEEARVRVQEEALPVSIEAQAQTWKILRRRGPPPLPPRPHKPREGESGPPSLLEIGPILLPIVPAPTSVQTLRVSYETLTLILEPAQETNPFADSLDGKIQTVRRTLPQGAKPKERPFVGPAPPSFMSNDSPQDAASQSSSSSSFIPAKSESYNPLYQLHHKGANQAQQQQGQLISMNSSISHVNHGFFDSSFNFDPSMDILQGNKASPAGQTSIAPPAQFQTQIERPPSLLPKNSSSGVAPFDHGLKELESFPNGGCSEKEFGSSLMPGNKPNRDSDFEGSLHSEEGQLDSMNARLGDDLEGMESSGDRLVVNGDKGRSWIKKKIRQIKSATSKGNKVNEPDLDQRSDDLQVILNPALVKNGFLDGSEMKASSVPSNSGEDILRKYRGLRRTQSSELLEDGLQPDSSADENSSHSDRPDSTAAEPDSSDLSCPLTTVLLRLTTQRGNSRLC
ncbi:putative GTPase-activating protein and VPS9 domain-containing protein 1 [Apostichopus japonicus]|uniref:Putative GTPase-activating protein and VPS9 domain-containing protein 1 n=1 Tax=Stichopus japonicus TaxID=307972 RepID=A0A2G8L9F3_STIJA|nr:putative GTPase-activating protein and VPS9 domain-containing protein 1 [Apostichopus japonicus]